MTDEGEVISRRVLIDYMNWRGERSMRRIVPRSIFFGSNEWHPEPQWILKAFDLQKRGIRTFAMNKIHEWRDPP
jgi:predicted DNA-binding transcriptional regulator YafY